MGANSSYRDRIIGQSVNVHRFETGLQQQVLGHLRTLEEELVRSIQKMDLDGVSRDTFKRARAEKMLDQVRATIGKQYHAINGTVRESLVDLSKAQAKAMNKIAKDVFKGSVLTTSLTPGDLRSIASNVMIDGNPVSDYWAKQAEGTRMNFAREVRMGLLAGETTSDIVKRVRGRDTGSKVVVQVNGKSKVVPKFAGGVMDIPTRQANTLVRTAVQAVSVDVMKKTYEENGDVVRAISIMGTLDLRTCPECGSYDGGIWDTDTGQPTPESPVQGIEFPGYPLYHPG